LSGVVPERERVELPGQHRCDEQRGDEEEEQRREVAQRATVDRAGQPEARGVERPLVEQLHRGRP
jgi:hypothetical protein